MEKGKESVTMMEVIASVHPSQWSVNFPPALETTFVMMPTTLKLVTMLEEIVSFS